MPEVTRSVEVGAPPRSVWRLLEDVRRLPELSTSTVSVDGAPDRLTEVGQTFEQTVELAGRHFTSTWEVVAIEPGRSLVVEGSVLPRTHYRMTERLTPSDDGTRVDLTMDYRLPFGPLGRLAGKLGAERRAVDGAEEVLAGIKAVTEAAGRDR